MIKSINNNPLILKQSPTLSKSESKSSTQQIAASFEKVFDEVNQSQLQAESKINEMVAGKSKDIPGTIMAMEKADVSMKMMMAIRNKVVSTYEEIMRMQV
ncbi:MAG: flagellar hook-basal body complex protein FliE [Deltaproteobacteria bacterium]|nr:flagellar hook-basal body complex protein FliE [Deltaproteobacteria bacterium]